MPMSAALLQKTQWKQAQVLGRQGCGGLLGSGEGATVEERERACGQGRLLRCTLTVAMDTGVYMCAKTTQDAHAHNTVRRTGGI